MSDVNDYLLPEHERPAWLNYPAELVALVAAGRINLTPWHLTEIDAVRGDIVELKARLGRDLVSFAHRQDREDMACFEKGKGCEVLIIHDNTEPGWEDEGSYPTFSDWLTDVEEEARSWGGDY